MISIFLNVLKTVENLKTLKKILKGFEISVLVNNAGLISNSLLVNYMKKILCQFKIWDDT